MATCIITRRLHFNAAHRVYDPALSDEENLELFGPCSNPHYHGHNYELDVSVEGEIDPKTGYVMDLARLKAIVEHEVLRHLDHRNLNVEVPFLSGVNPTAEQIAVACWNVLAPHLAPARLHRVRLWETPRNFVDYYGS